MTKGPIATAINSDRVLRAAIMRASSEANLSFHELYIHYLRGLYTHVISFNALPEHCACDNSKLSCRDPADAWLHGAYMLETINLCTMAP